MSTGNFSTSGGGLIMKADTKKDRSIAFRDLFLLVPETKNYLYRKGF